MFRPAVLYMIGAAFCFSIMGLFVKLAGRWLPSQEIVAIRGFLTLIFSAAIVWRSGVSPVGKQTGLLLLRGFFGFLALSCFYWSVCHLPMAEATVLQHTNPVFTAFFAALFLGERLQVGVAASAALSLAGVVLVARPASLFGAGVISLEPVGVMIALAGAISSASAYVTIRVLARSEHPDVIVLYFPLVTVPLSLPPLAWGAVWPGPTAWLALLAVAVSTQLAQVCLTRALTLEKAASATAIGYLQVVFAVIWGAAVFDEMPDWRTLVGAAMVVLGTLLVAATSRTEPVEAGPVDPP